MRIPKLGTLCAAEIILQIAMGFPSGAHAQADATVGADTTLPKVVLLATGGTIASVYDSASSPREGGCGGGKLPADHAADLMVDVTLAEE